jgi:hypothetical protein
MSLGAGSVVVKLLYCHPSDVRITFSSPVAVKIAQLLHKMRIISNGSNRSTAFSEMLVTLNQRPATPCFTDFSASAISHLEVHMSNPDLWRDDERWRSVRDDRFRHMAQSTPVLPDYFRLPGPLRALTFPKKNGPIPGTGPTLVKSALHQKNNFTPSVMLRIPPLNNFWFRKFGSNGNAYPGVVVAVVTPALLNTLPLLRL